MADDLFLKLDGIKGESQDAKHKDEIDLESFSWGVSNNGAGGGGGGGGAGKATFTGITFVAPTSVASPPLLLATANGKHIKNAVLTVRKGGKKNGVDYVKITFTDVVVASYQQSDSVESGPARDIFSLRFAKIEFAYSRQRPSGKVDPPVVAGWDLKANKPI